MFDILEEVGLLGDKLQSSPIGNEAKFWDSIFLLLTNIYIYCHPIGKLIYLMSTCPGISYIVSLLSQLMHAPYSFISMMLFLFLLILSMILGMAYSITFMATFVLKLTPTLAMGVIMVTSDRYYVAYKPITPLCISLMFIELKFIHSLSFLCDICNKVHEHVQ